MSAQCRGRFLLQSSVALIFLGSSLSLAEEVSRAPINDAQVERVTHQSQQATEHARVAVDEAAEADKRASEANEKATTASKQAGEASNVAASAAKDAAKAAQEAARAADRIDAALEKSQTSQSRAEISAASHRLVRNIGAYLSLWGDPFPTTLGINVAYNVYDWARVNLGIGSDTTEPFKTTTAGLGVKFMVPKWPLTPVVGMNLAFTKSDTDTPRSVRGFDPRGTHLYSNVGVDWETGLGLNFAVGYNIPLQSGISGSYYLNAGLFL